MDPQNQKVPPQFDGQQQVNPTLGYPSMQSGPMPMPPPAYESSTVQQPPVITQQPSVVYIQSPQFGPQPMAVQCPTCSRLVVTSVEYKSSAKTHYFAVLICLLGGCLGCCLIPYHVNSCLNATHSCPTCQHFLGDQDSRLR